MLQTRKVHRVANPTIISLIRQSNNPLQSLSTHSIDQSLNRSLQNISRDQKFHHNVLALIQERRNNNWERADTREKKAPLGNEKTRGETRVDRKFEEK